MSSFFHLCFIQFYCRLTNYKYFITAISISALHGFSFPQAPRSSEAVKKQSSDWSSSGWDADDSLSNEKEGQGQSSPGEDGWGNDWEEETATASANETVPPLEGVRLTSEYNWDSSSSSSSSTARHPRASYPLRPRPHRAPPQVLRPSQGQDQSRADPCTSPATWADPRPCQ